MIVVSDASPLIALARIERLELLRSLFGRLIIPNAVWRELVLSGDDKAGNKALLQADWVETHSVSDDTLTNLLRHDLGAGESEAIVLAKELGADFLLIDERLGRSAAKNLGIKTVGLIGALIEARRRGLLPDAPLIANELREKAGFWISKELYALLIGE